MQHPASAWDRRPKRHRGLGSPPSPGWSWRPPCVLCLTTPRRPQGLLRQPHPEVCASSLPPDPALRAGRAPDRRHRGWPARRGGGFPTSSGANWQRAPFETGLTLYRDVPRRRLLRYSLPNLHRPGFFDHVDPDRSTFSAMTAVSSVAILASSSPDDDDIGSEPTELVRAAAGQRLPRPQPNARVDDGIGIELQTRPWSPTTGWELMVDDRNQLVGLPSRSRGLCGLAHQVPRTGPIAKAGPRAITRPAVVRQPTTALRSRLGESFKLFTPRDSRVNSRRHQFRRRGCRSRQRRWLLSRSSCTASQPHRR